METLITMCFYMLTMLISMFFAELAKKKEDIRFLIIPIILLSLIAGCRSYEVGTDTLRVVESIEYTCKKGVFSHSKEYLYYFICVILMKIWNNPSFVLFFLALLTNGLIFTRIWDFRSNLKISVTTSLYFMYYFGMSMNITRQCLAVAIVFYFTRYLQKKDYVKFLLGVILAFFIHVSSIIAIVFPIIYLLHTEKPTKRTWKIIAGIAVVGIIPFGYMVYRYAEYFTGLTIDIGKMQVVWLVLLGVSCIPIYWKKRAGLAVNNKTAENEDIRLIFIISLIGGVIAFFGYIIPWAGRVGYVFKVFEILFFGMIFDADEYNEKFRWLIYGILVILGIYTLMTYAAVVPYSVIW